jgi:hypothetical protein
MASSLLFGSIGNCHAYTNSQSLNQDHKLKSQTKGAKRKWNHLRAAGYKDNRHETYASGAAECPDRTAWALLQPLTLSCRSHSSPGWPVPQKFSGSEFLTQNQPSSVAATLGRPMSYLKLNGMHTQLGLTNQVKVRLHSSLPVQSLRSEPSRMNKTPIMPHYFWKTFQEQDKLATLTHAL